MVGVIDRDLARAARRRHDLIVVGGGVYGCALALEASRRGLSALLVERDDFGQHTSWNSLRIVHGGLRYLQALDLPRHAESVRERRWFLRTFPDLVRPLPCLMPLYDRGAHRRSVFRAAFALDAALSRSRNEGLREDRRLDAGRVLSADETAALFPAVARDGLRGGALWHDAVMPDSQRLLVEILRWAAGAGAQALNYVEALRLALEGGRVAGLVARDRVAGGEWSFAAPVVVNAAGPWSRPLARELDRDLPRLFRPSLAINLFLDREPPSSAAIAVRAPAAGSRTYFLHPWKGGVLAGTEHLPCSGEADGDGPTEEQVSRFLERLGAALGARAPAPRDVLRVHWGHLPAAEAGTDRLAVREAFLDHGAHGGPRGLFSVSGVKFTTARLVAEKTLRRIFGGAAAGPAERPAPREVPDAEAAERALRADPQGLASAVARLAAEESVIRPEDLLLRRTDWGADPRRDAELPSAVERWLGHGGRPTDGEDAP